MSVTAQGTDAFRALSRLEGVLRGIIADEVMNPAERSALLEWLETHRNLIDICPFSDAYQIAWQAGKDGTIDRQAWQDLIDFCHTTAAESVDTLTKDIRTLHGYMQGILSDSVISVEELTSLGRWMEAHNSVKDKWPFNQVAALIADVLSDNKVTDQEHRQLQQFFSDFCEKTVDGFIPDFGVHNNRPWTSTDAPTVETIDHVCVRGTEIQIEGRSFCFTGQMKAAKRNDIHKHLIELGGIPKDNVVKDLNYLVIGANSNPCWTYSTYGRKIEKAIESNRDGCNIVILHEDDYIATSNFPKWYEKR